MQTVAVLFARADSHYKAIPGCDVWDIERDARKWLGGSPVVAHPPCRAWGRLRQFAHARPDEKALAIKAVENVRRFGGVLEHPAESTLFAHCGLPRPGRFPDEFGGWSMEIQQFHFGHRAEKSTWLYIVGCTPDELPAMPKRDGKPTHCVRPTRTYPRLPSITKAEREHTPPNWRAGLSKWPADANHLQRPQHEPNSRRHQRAEMNITEIIDTLTKHNDWRRGGDGALLDTKLIGEAIDGAIAELSTIAAMQARIAEIEKRRYEIPCPNCGEDGLTFSHCAHCDEYMGAA